MDPLTAALERNARLLLHAKLAEIIQRCDNVIHINRGHVCDYRQKLEGVRSVAKEALKQSAAILRGEES